MLAAAHGVISSIWGPNGGSARYGIHFGYPIGSAIGPLIAIPFLGDSTDSNTTSTQGFLFSIQKIYSLSQDLTNNDDDVTDDTTIEFAYLIGSGVSLILTTIFVLCTSLDQEVHICTETHCQKRKTVGSKLFHPGPGQMEILSSGQR